MVVNSLTYVLTFETKSCNIYTRYGPNWMSASYRLFIYCITHVHVEYYHIQKDIISMECSENELKKWKKKMHSN